MRDELARRRWWRAMRAAAVRDMRVPPPIDGDDGRGADTVSGMCEVGNHVLCAEGGCDCDCHVEEPGR